MLPEPEVRRIALPSKGARLIIASDGLWDAMNPKTAVHHVRGMTAGKAAGELVRASSSLQCCCTAICFDLLGVFMLAPCCDRPVAVSPQSCLYQLSASPGQLLCCAASVIASA